MGGAFSTLGADFSVLSTNPAGIGVYKRGEMTISPVFGYTGIESAYLGKTADDYKYNFNINGFGMVFAGKLAKQADESKPQWKGVQFGFGVNRLQNFHGRSIIEGLNENGTILDVYHSYAQGIPYDQLNPFDTELAYNTYLLDTLSFTDNYVQAHYGGAIQRETKTTKGGVNEMVITLGGNYNDRLYIGGTIGVPFIRYEEYSTYSEVDERDSIPGFKSLAIKDELTTFGTGFNFKLGIIYRITDWVRISGAFHTPTFFTMTDEWQRDMYSKLDFGNYNDKSPRGRYEYSLMTPMRAIGGIAFVIGQRGTVSAEYEMVDYSEARLSEKNESGGFFNQNEVIRNSYTSAGNIRVGTEWVFMPFSVRAGYALYGSPFKSGLNDASEQLISAGVGIREQGYFIDFAYVNASSKYDHYLYPGVVEPAKSKASKHAFVTTLGIRF